MVGRIWIHGHGIDVINGPVMRLNFPPSPTLILGLELFRNLFLFLFFNFPLYCHVFTNNFPKILIFFKKRIQFSIFIFDFRFFRFLIIYYRPPLLPLHSTKCRPPLFLLSFRLPFSFPSPDFSIHLTYNSHLSLEGSPQSALSVLAPFLRLFAPESPHCGALTENWRTSWDPILHLV
jgi:hypothetical protein